MEHYQTQVKDIGVLLLESENLPDEGANKQTMRDRMKNHMNQQLQVKSHLLSQFSHQEVRSSKLNIVVSKTICLKIMEKYDFYN